MANEAGNTRTRRAGCLAKLLLAAAACFAVLLVAYAYLRTSDAGYEPLAAQVRAAAPPASGRDSTTPGSDAPLMVDVGRRTLPAFISRAPGRPRIGFTDLHLSSMLLLVEGGSVRCDTGWRSTLHPAWAAAAAERQPAEARLFSPDSPRRPAAPLFIAPAANPYEEGTPGFDAAHASACGDPALLREDLLQVAESVAQGAERRLAGSFIDATPGGDLEPSPGGARAAMRVLSALRVLGRQSRDRDFDLLLAQARAWHRIGGPYDGPDALEVVAIHGWIVLSANPCTEEQWRALDGALAAEPPADEVERHRKALAAFYVDSKVDELLGTPDSLKPASTTVWRALYDEKPAGWWRDAWRPVLANEYRKLGARVLEGRADATDKLRLYAFFTVADLDNTPVDEWSQYIEDPDDVTPGNLERMDAMARVRTRVILALARHVGENGAPAPALEDAVAHELLAEARELGLEFTYTPRFQPVAERAESYSLLRVSGPSLWELLDDEPFRSVFDYAMPLDPDPLVEALRLLLERDPATTPAASPAP
ncbi:MAG: hypothetical protein SF028_02900 [Candidatus Sumerlaeia bacterium]|nr:hypothetical protein [Candidatus Sumerlaeia bacterium]